LTLLLAMLVALQPRLRRHIRTCKDQNGLGGSKSQIPGFEVEPPEMHLQL